MSVIGAFIVPHPPLIIPEVGKGQEKEIQKTINSYKEVARLIATLQPETIVILTPHSIMYSDYFHISPGFHASGNFGMYQAKEVQIETDYDAEFISKLSESARNHNFMAGTMGEKNKSLDHATMIPLYFINEVYQNYKTVRVGLSGQSYVNQYELGKLIQKTADTLDRKTVIIASGDLSHKLTQEGPYGYAKEGPEYDKDVTEALAFGDFSRLFRIQEDFCEKAAECGHRAFLIMAGALDQLTLKPEFLSYEGPFGVGYGVCTFTVTGKDENRCFDKRYLTEERLSAIKSKESSDAYVRLARQSLECYLYEHKILELPEKLPDEMISRRAGVFVSIKKFGQLRGCIGTIEPTRNSVALEIIENAVSAAVSDPRFKPIESEELDDLVISVDVLGKSELIASVNELDVKRYGVIVTNGRRRGLLLPNLEGIDTVEEQIRIAKRKADILDNEEVTLERFEVIRHY